MIQVGFVCQVDGWSPQFDSQINLCHHAKAKCLRLGPDKRGYAPDVSVTSRTGTAAYRSWMRRVRQCLVNGVKIVYDAGFYPASDEGVPAEGSWAELGGDAWLTYSEEVSSGDYRDSVPPQTTWAAGLEVDLELIGYARAECESLGLDPDEYIIISGPNEPGAIGGKGADAFGWDFSTGEDAFVDWMNFHMPALRSAFPGAQIETPILGGLYSSTSVATDLSATVAAIATIAGIGLDLAPYDRFAMNCYISYKSQAAPDPDVYAASYLHKVQSVAGKLMQLGLPSRIAINELGVSKNDMNIGFMSMVGSGIRIRKCLDNLARLSYVDRAMVYKGGSANSGEDSSTAGEYAMIRYGSGGTLGQWNASAVHIVSRAHVPPATANSSHADLKLSDHADMGAWASSGVAARATGYYAPAGQASVESQAVQG